MISHPKVSLNLTAHLSSKACAKVWLAAKEMAEVLCFELLPRLDVWPKSFKSSKLIDDNIAIYFFSVKGRDDQVFDNLLYNLRHYDFALKALDLRVNYIYGAFSMEDKLLLNTHPMIVSFIIPE